MDRNIQADKAFLKWSEATSNNVVHIADAWYAAVEWADKTMLDKVCKWLEEHLLLDDPKWYVEGEKTLQEKMIDDLRKAMEEQQ